MAQRFRLCALTLLAASPAAAPAAPAPPPVSAPLTARRYVAAVLAASPEIAQAEESWRAARDAYRSREAATFLPTLSFTAQDYPYGDDPTYSYAFHGARLRRSDATFTTSAGWNLFHGFQDWLKTLSAGDAAESASRSLDAARQDRAYAALQTFYQLESRERLVEVARQDLDAQKTQYEQTRDLYKQGLKSQSDLYKSENDWRASEIRMASAQADYKGSLQPFNELLNRPPWEEHALSDDLTPGATDLPPLEEDAARLPERRPEIASALLDARTARRARRQALLAALPTLSVDAAWNRTDAPGSSPTSHGQIGLALSLPFGFNGVSQVYDYAAARARARRAQAAADLSLRSARNDLYAAWVGLQRAILVYDLAERQEQIAARGLDIVAAQYQQGATDALRMTQARSDLLSARVQKATALQDIFVNRAAYRRAAGEPLW
jgi:outer membrane protein TolC